MILTILVRACDQDQDQRADFPIRWVTGYAAKASTTSRPIAVFVILRLTTNADLMFSLYTEASSISFIISSAARTMEAISIALDIPSPNLLDTTDLDPKTHNELAGDRAPQSLPAGYQRFCAVMTDYQAYLASLWDEANRKKIRGPIAPKKSTKSR